MFRRRAQERTSSSGWRRPFAAIKDGWHDERAIMIVLLVVIVFGGTVLFTVLADPPHHHTTVTISEPTTTTTEKPGRLSNTEWVTRYQGRDLHCLTVGGQMTCDWTRWYAEGGPKNPKQ